MPPEFFADRAAMQRPEVMAAALPVEHIKAQFVLDLQMINRQLSAADFMLGLRFTLADAAVFHVLNFAGSAPSLRAEIDAHPAIRKWLKGILDMGQGQRSDIEPSAALDIARDASPDLTPPANAIEDAALTVGANIAIRPNDYGQEETIGEIVWVTADALAVKRTDEQIGDVLVHYPRLGYLFETRD